MADDSSPEPPPGAPAGPRPPDPGRVLTQADFARELTCARQHAGLTVRQVAKACGMPVSTIGGYFAGRHLPPAARPGLLPAILAGCGENDPARVRQWQQALHRARRPPGKRPTGVPAPYRGLASFRPQDAGWFFGREELTLHLVRLATAAQGTGLPLVVVGPSGSGKSSLLCAGLIPRLTAGTSAGGRPVALFTPGSSPLRALASALWPLLPHDQRAGPPEEAASALREDPGRAAVMIGRAAGLRPAVIVDQFEETFTECGDEAERRAFIGALSALSGATLVVFGLRADFYGHALRYEHLARCLQERQIAVGPMTAGQLRRAIVAPARKAGLEIEEGLAELLMRDMRPHGGGGAGHEAGALPLLSHALLTTWERSHGRRLTVAGYQASGGISDAIARTAEAAWSALDDEAGDTARQLFLRLVHVADGTIQTRARVPLSDLPADGPGGTSTPAAVLARFVEQRLVTLDAGTAEITHEALLDAWPRLRAWIDADRDDIRARRFITSAAQAWQDSGRESAALLRGGPLAIARDWGASPSRRASLSTLAREFVDACAAGEQARQSAQRRQTRRLHRLVASLTVLVLATVGLAGYAFGQRSYAFQQRRLARAAEDVAQSRTVAVEADKVRAEDPALAAQLSLAAYRIAPTAGALASLLESTGAPMAARLRDTTDVVQSIALDPGRPLLAVAAADGTLRLWDTAAPGHPFPVGSPVVHTGGPLYTVAFSPDGRVMAAAGADRTVRLWRVGATGGATVLTGPLTGPRNTVYSLAFSPGGRLLAAGSADGGIWLWNVTDPGRPRPLGPPLAGAGGYVESVAFSPDGHLLAAGTADGTVRLWNVTDPARPTPVGRPLTGPAGIVDSVTFSPDGTTLAAGSRDASVWLWNVTDPARPVRAAPLTGAKDWVNAVAFSPDGTVLAAASSDDRVLLWNVATRALIAALPHPQPVTSLAWDGTGVLITASADGFVRCWQVPPPVLLAGGGVNSVSFSPGGGSLAVGGPDLQVWNPARHTLTAARAAPGGMVNAVAFAPGGKLLAAGYGNGRFQLWRAAARLAPLGTPITASATGLVEFVAFRRDGRVLATAGDDGTVRLWDVTDPARPAALATVHDSGSYVFSVAFSPDGHLLAAASADGLTRLWNVTDPARPRRVGPALRGPSSYAISVAFSPDGHLLAVGSADKTVRLWNVTDPARPRRTGPKLTGPGGYVYSVAFSPGGTILAAGSTDGSVWLWDLTDPARPVLLTSMSPTSGHIYTVAFSPRGTTLAAAGSDGSVWLWDTGARAAAARICAMGGQPLSRAEWRDYVPGRPYQPPCPG